MKQETIAQKCAAQNCQSSIRNKELNELEQLLFEWLINTALPKQINQNLFLDCKKVFNRYIPILYKTADKCKKNPAGWTTEVLNIDKLV